MQINNAINNAIIILEMNNPQIFSDILDKKKSVHGFTVS